MRSSSLHEQVEAALVLPTDEALAWADGLERLLNIAEGRLAYIEQYGDEPWARWLLDLFPQYFADPAGKIIPFGQMHADFWRHVWSIRPDAAPLPFLACWPRDFGKSTNAEMAVAYLLGEGVRKYCWYVSATQDQADGHVQNIAGLLESPAYAARYPKMAEKQLSKFGDQRAWRINRLWTAAGVVIDAVGLDTAARGGRVMEHRPDLIVPDDIDSERDGATAVDKKLNTLSRGIFPAGNRKTRAILFPQNRIHDDSCLARILERRTDILSQRIVSGPHPAIEGLEYDKTPTGTKILGGTPTWAGFSLDLAQEAVNTFGIRAFLAEHQHERGARGGALWDQDAIDNRRIFDTKALPRMVRCVVGVDPPAKESSKTLSEAEAEEAAECGIVVAALGEDGVVYVLDDRSEILLPAQWGARATGAYWDWNANWVIAEKNNGGAMVRYVLETCDPKVAVDTVWAAQGKMTRAEPVAVLYERGLVRHVGTFQALEAQMCTYDGKKKSPDRLDALVWAVWKLKIERDEDYPDLDKQKHGIARVPRREDA